ncbi:hypothetical protein ACWEQJ_33780, partial [Streptomyces cyaneofuscatus]
INELIRRVAARGAHVLTVLDSCHSGGATRGMEVGIRSAPAHTAPRPVEEYLPEVRSLWEAARDGGTCEALPAWPEPPRHVALAACDSFQLAKELPLGGRYRGVFSAMLHRALGRLGTDSTYRDLLGAASAGVRDMVLEQEPVGYAVPTDALDQPLFGGVIRPREHGIMLEHYRDQWWIDAGSAHGIQPPDDGDTTTLAVLGPDRGDSSFTRAVLGQARVIEVEAARSRVGIEPGRMGGELDAGARYRAVLVDVPVPRAAVSLHGDAAGTALMREQLTGSAHVREGGPDPGPHGDRFHVLCPSPVPGQGSRFVIARPDGTSLAPPVAATREGAVATVRRLEHLARWHLIKRLDNPGSALSHGVGIEIVPAVAGETTPPARGTRPPLVPASDGRIHLHYRKAGSAWQRPYVWIYLDNASPRDLYCTLLDLTDRYRCHSRLYPGALLPAGSTTVAFDGRPVDISLPRDRLGTPGSEVTDWLKLIASEQRLAPGSFELPALDGVLPAGSAGRDISRRGILGRLGDPVATRDAGELEEEGPDWTTTLVTLRTFGPV